MMAVAAAAVVSSDHEAAEKVDPEVELIHVKWPQTETAATDRLEINTILSSWKNPVFKFQAEPCHVTTTNSRFCN